MRLFLVFTSVILLFSCNISNYSDSNTAYFGGEIDNPKNDYVTFNRSETEIDTLTLDDENRFMVVIEDVEEGLYRFNHGGEYQLVFIEPNDSLVLRLNTRDFDESLVFTGKGAKKNNFFTKLYLDHETFNTEVLKHLNLEPEQFHKYIDSLRLTELEELHKFTQSKNTSKKYERIAEGRINYHYYFYKELYPFGYYGYNRLIHFKDLPEDFYSYRKDVNFNDDILAKLPDYWGYLEWYFRNIALNEVYKSGDHNLKFNKQSLNYNKAKLTLIDSVISNPRIKDYLLTNVIRDFISESEDTTKIKNIADLYYTLITSERNKNFIKEFVDSRLNFKIGKELPEVMLVNIDNELVQLKDIIDKPSVIYFWSTNQLVNAKQSHKIINKLKSKYEGINFIGINVNEYQPIYWNETIDEHSFDRENEYYFKSAMDGAIALSADLRNVIITDSNGRIMNVHVDLFKDDLNDAIKQLKKMELIEEKSQ